MKSKITTHNSGSALLRRTGFGCATFCFAITLRKTLLSRKSLGERLPTFFCTQGDIFNDLDKSILST